MSIEYGAFLTSFFTGWLPVIFLLPAGLQDEASFLTTSISFFHPLYKIRRELTKQHPQLKGDASKKFPLQGNEVREGGKFFAGCNPLLKDHDLLPKDHDLLPRDHDLLLRDHDLLSKDHDLLSKDCDLLLKDHDLLLKDCDLLLKDCELLLKDHELLLTGWELLFPFREF